MEVKLCENCIKELADYNPYNETPTITKVELKDCDNYTVNGKFVNVE